MKNSGCLLSVNILLSLFILLNFKKLRFWFTSPPLVKQRRELYWRVVSARMFERIVCNSRVPEQPSIWWLTKVLSLFFNESLISGAAFFCLLFCRCWQKSKSPWRRKRLLEGHKNNRWKIVELVCLMVQQRINKLHGIKLPQTFNTFTAANKANRST